MGKVNVALPFFRRSRRGKRFGFSRAVLRDKSLRMGGFA